MSNNFLLQLPVRGYELLCKVATVMQIPVLLFFRLNWGWQFYQTGIGKLTGHAQVVDYFTQLHIPYPDLNAWFVGGVETVGGILLILGLASRPVGMVLAVNMIVAYLSVDDDRNTALNFFKDQDPFFEAKPFFFLLTALIVFAFGAGLVSVDAAIAWWRKKHQAES